MIVAYVHSNALGERIGGILCIRELVSCTSASAEAKCLRFSKALSQALSNNTGDADLVELIADTVGHMARYLVYERRTNHSNNKCTPSSNNQVEPGLARGLLRRGAQSSARLAENLKPN
jgi:hypothetical protein